MIPIEGRNKFLHPWPLDQLELHQGIALTNPCCQQFAQSYIIGTVHSGMGFLHYRNTSQEITKGSFYVIQPEEAWSCQSKALTFSHLLVDSALLHHVATEIVETEKPRLYFPDAVLRDTTLSQFLEDHYARLITSTSRLEEQELLLETVARLLLPCIQDRKETGQLGSERRATQRVKEYLAEYYAEDVSLETLASVANVSAFHMARVFRQVVGIPPHAYQIQLRLWQARKLLVQGFPASYVAQETGFFDQTHLTRMFKYHFGVTPGSYRKTARLY